MGPVVRSSVQALGWLAGLGMIAWGLEQLTPWTGWYQLSAGVALLGLGGLRPLGVLITDGVVPLMQEE